MGFVYHFTKVLNTYSNIIAETIGDCKLFFKFFCVVQKETAAPTDGTAMQC